MKNTTETSAKSNIVRGEFRRGVVARIIDAVKLWNDRKVAIRSLNSLSDRMLKDIGITRNEITGFVKNPGSYAHMIALRTDRVEVTEEIRRAA